MQSKEGRARFDRRANRPFGEAPLYSKPFPSLTEKLMLDWVATPTAASSRRKFG
jgi:hypothetical protein